MLPTYLARRSFFTSLVAALPAWLLGRRVPAGAVTPRKMPPRPRAKRRAGERFGATTYLFDARNGVRPEGKTISFYDAHGRLRWTQSLAHARDAGDERVPVPASSPADTPAANGAEKPGGDGAGNVSD